MNAACRSVIEALEGRTFFDATNCPNTSGPFICFYPPPDYPGLDGPAPDGNSTDPINQFTGIPIADQTDIDAEGFGGDLDYTRRWSGVNNTGANGNGWTPSAAPYIYVYSTFNPQTQANDKPVVAYVDRSGGMRVYDLSTATGATSSTARFYGQESLAYDPSTTHWTVTDPDGNAFVFNDLPRVGGGLTADVSVGYVNQGSYGKAIQSTDAGGVLTTYSYYASGAAAGQVSAINRTDATTGEAMELEFSYGNWMNSLGGSVELISSVSFVRRSSSIASYQAVRTATYDYYTGEGTDAAEGRLGDLKLVTIHDGSSTGTAIDHSYYRYSKLWGYTRQADPGPTSNVSTMGGTDTSYAHYTSPWTDPNGYYTQGADNSVWSGLQLEVRGAAYDRLQANISSSASATDAQIKPYANYEYTYSRWADFRWEYENYGNINFAAGYHYYTRYHVVQQLAQGWGSSDAAGGQGTFGYEYSLNQSTTGNGNDEYDPNVWRVRTTEYLPDSTNLDADGNGRVDPGDWADNDRNVTYLNEVGQVMLKNEVDVDTTVHSISGISRASRVVTVTSTSHGLATGDFIAINGAVASATGLPAGIPVGVDLELYNGIYQVTVTSSSTFTYTLPATPSNTAAPDASSLVWSKVLKQSLTYYRYSQETATGSSYVGFGQIVLKADPSAVTGYDESNKALVTSGLGATFNNQYLSDSSGLITLYTYYASTTATNAVPGGADGYLWQTKIKHGEKDGSTTILTGGTLLDSKQYLSRTVGSITVFPLATYITYASGGGGGSQTTSYLPAYLTGSVRPRSITTTLPSTSGQNGPGTGNVADVIFDVYGNPIWTRDGDGYLTYRQFDPGTGHVIKLIEDVDTTQTATFTDLPSGWATPATGGLHLTTQAKVDGLGRKTQTIDPNGNVNISVYNDPAHEVRSYLGWNATTGTALKPVHVEREYRPAAGASSGQRTVYEEMLDSSATPSVSGTAGSYVPTGTETLSTSNILALTRVLTNDSNQAVELDVYFTLAASGGGLVTYSQATPRFGSSSDDSSTGNYHLTLYGYDERGRKSRVVTPSGTIYKTTFEERGYRSASWVGTNDELIPGTDNMVRVASYEYDVSGNQTRANDYPVAQINSAETGQNVAPPHVVRMYYDWRNRLVARKGGVEVDGSGDPIAVGSEDTSLQRPLSVYTYDNADRLVATDIYDGDRVSLSFDASGAVVIDSDDSGTAADVLSRRARSETSYDGNSKVYQSRSYSVSQTTGALGSNVLVTNFWYDRRGNLIKTDAPGGVITKSSYDGAGRTSRTYELDDNGTDSVYGDADDVIGDTVLEQTDYTYDGDGNQILSARHLRFHDAANKTGSTTEGDYILGSPSGTKSSSTSGVRAARVSFVAMYYDAVNRVVASVDAGTNGGSSYARPNSPPSRSPITLVTSYAFDEANHRTTVTDPRGITTRSDTDLAGRITTSIAAYVDGTPRAGDDQTTQYTYTGNGDLLTLKVVLPGSAIQETKYVYAEPTQTASAVTRSGNTVTFNLAGHGYQLGEMVMIAGASDPAYNGTFRVASVPNANSFTYTITGTPTSPAVGTVTVRRAQALFRNDQLVATNYPDKSSGSASASEAEHYVLDALGEQLHVSDRRGDIHDFTYDLVGRTTRDTVYTLGTGVQGSVRTLEWSFDTAGRLYQATSRSSSATGQVIVNQIRRMYNDFGQLTVEYQEHVGAVNTGIAPTTPYTGYGYSFASGTSRLTSMTYPGGRVLTYVYGTSGSTDDDISRIASLKDGSTTLEAYKFLGLGTVIERDRPDEPHTRQSLVTGDTLVSGYAGDQYTGLDQFGRVVDQDWQTISGGSVAGHIDRYQYAYDEDGNVLYKDNKVNSAFSELYVADRDTVTGTDGSYDLLNRLIAFQRGALSDVNTDGRLDSDTASTLSNAWNLDALGNWASATIDSNGDASGSSSTTTRTHNGQNQITSGSLVYDADGNLISQPAVPIPLPNTVQYDAWNRLAYRASVAGYPFDALGRRVREEEMTDTWYLGEGVYDTGTARTDLYYSDRGQVIEDRTYVNNYDAGEDDPATVLYAATTTVWSPGYVNELVSRDRTAEGTTSRVYVQQDANYNVTSLTNSTGTVAERFSYDPYGAVAYQNGSWATQSRSASDFRNLFQGGRWVVGIGAYQFGKRDYDPRIGRWLQRDPVEYGDGLNQYQFVADNPSRYLDPTGTIRWDTLKPAGPSGTGIPVLDKFFPNSGQLYEVQTDAGHTIRVFEGDLSNKIAKIGDNQTKVDIGKVWWCHGYTFGGDRGDRKLSPFGSDVDTILNDEYKPVVPADVRPGDVVIYRDKAGAVLHSGVISAAEKDGSGSLDPNKTMVTQKSGIFKVNGDALGPNEVIDRSVSGTQGKFPTTVQLDYYRPQPSPTTEPSPTTRPAP